MASERITLTVPGPGGNREVGLSSPNRVLFPELGITKHELAEYLLAVARTDPTFRARVQESAARVLALKSRGALPPR